MTRQKRRRNPAPEPNDSNKRPRRSGRLHPGISSPISYSRSRSVSVHGSETGQHSAPISSATTSKSIVSSSSATDKYIVQDDEIMEDEDLCELLGESQCDSDDEEGTLPVRILSYFEIYDFDTGERKVLPMDVDPDEDVVFYGASGLVTPQLVEEEEDDDSSDLDDDSIAVKLSAIQELWTNKREIWIKTKYSWYILEYPAPKYRKYFKKMKLLARNYMARSSERRMIGRPSQAGEPPSMPFVTPRVGEIAQGLFLRSLIMSNECMPTKSNLQNVCVPDVPFVIHDTNPTEILWGEKVPETEGFYRSVFLDGVEYHVGDTVAVAAPVSSDSEEDASDKLQDTAWFGEIRYFFDRVNGKSNKRKTAEKYFHLRWFSHGSQTVLGETANPQALFLLDQCDDNPVESILQKITVHYLKPGDLEPVVISDKDVGSSVFHLSYKWDEGSMTMSTIDLDAEKDPTSAVGSVFWDQPEHKRCYACAVRERKELAQMCNKLETDILEMYEMEYHRYDFVYVRPKKQALLTVAQIVDLLPGESHLQVSLFDRVKPASEDEKSPELERSLSYTGRVENISAERLDGHCFVLRPHEIEDMNMWLEEPNNFILSNQKKPLKQCDKCVAIRKDHQERREELLMEGPLRAMDLFAGAGGLSTGMDMTGYVKTCWAVERDPSAAESLRMNHEDMVVYNQDCNVLLKHSAETREGKKLSPIRSLAKGKEVLPPLPSPGEIDIIIGGPPCQPFSGMNRFKRVDDVRQTCIPTLLSYVEFFRPQYCLIENVTGLLHYRLKGKQVGQRIVGGIESGMVKFIPRVFTSLGYQFQMRVLNSADYGAPQQRNRVIFWAARMDLILPKWPTPTHYPRLGHNSVIRNVANKFLAPLAHRREFEDDQAYAPFYAVTVSEAIDDLPSWDWKNPKVHYRKTAEKTGKTTFPADSAQWKSDSEDACEVSGYNYPVLYASPPRTVYQAVLRKEQSEFSRVEYHFTALFSTLVVERTVNVPVRPLANFKDLPKQLREVTTVTGRKKERVSANDTFWRLDGNGQFRTMMTIVNPASKGAYVIHPTDKRTLTVREQARAQGFPDTYEFCSVEDNMRSQIKDMERQIGNAVPVPLAYALGKALGDGLVEAEMKRRQEEGDRVLLEDEWEARSGVSSEL